MFNMLIHAVENLLLDTTASLYLFLEYLKWTWFLDKPLSSPNEIHVSVKRSLDSISGSLQVWTVSGVDACPLATCSSESSF